jgi:hypothetical protein
MIRKAHLKAQVAELEAELRITREEHDRQRQVLLRDLHTTIEHDITGRLRQENKEQVAEAKRRHGQLLRLAELSRAVLRIDAFDFRAPLLDPEKAEKAIRKLLLEIEEGEKVEASPTDEQAAELHGIGRRVEWPPESGKT